MHSNDWGLLHPFGIDGGELDGLSPQMCFVLGYELCVVITKIEAGEPFAMNLHVENKARVEATLKRCGWRSRVAFSHEDASESWLWLEAVRETAAGGKGE